jgi:hypothetical protein
MNLLNFFGRKSYGFYERVILSLPERWRQVEHKLLKASCILEVKNKIFEKKRQPNINNTVFQ